MIEIIIALFFIFLAIPALIFGLYGIIILYYGKMDKKIKLTKPKAKSTFEPLVSVVIATHNEQKIISKKIENLLSSKYDQNKLEIIFVDDSSDSTPQVIQEYSNKFPNVHLIRFEERMGYSPSMIAGCKAAKGEIIVLNDAGSFLDAEAIPHLVAHFDKTEKPEIGVVTGNDVILNVDENIGNSESFYLKIFNFLRTAETRMDSTFYIKGEATAVRKELINGLINATETFDTTVGLFVRKKGYRVIYDQAVKFYEYAPSTQSGMIQQKTIRGANLIKVLWHFRYMMFNRKYGKYGCVILPFNFGMLAVAPVAVMFCLATLIALTFVAPYFSLIIWAVFGGALLVSLVISKRLVTTFIRFEYSLLKAIYQNVFTRKTHDKIDKVDSTRR